MRSPNVCTDLKYRNSLQMLIDYPTTKTDSRQNDFTVTVNESTGTVSIAVSTGAGNQRFTVSVIQHEHSNTQIDEADTPDSFRLLTLSSNKALDMTGKCGTSVCATPKSDTVATQVWQLYCRM
jgi:hypothetical protein